MVIYQNDHLGTPQKLTAVNGAVVWSAMYSSFGEAIVDISSSITNNLRFSGQYFDQETGIHFNYHRYYDPATGRYLTADPIGLAGGINPYVYTSLNPINSIDPLGLRAGYRGVRGLIMRYGEVHYRKGVEDFFNEWGDFICNTAALHQIDPVMMFAIFKEELSHMLPAEYPAEVFLGLWDTVGPGQISVNVWSNQLGLDRDALTDISINIDAAAEILSIEQGRLQASCASVTPEMLGSRYNSSRAAGVTDYGLRVGNFYNELKSYADKKCSKKCE